MDSLEFTVGGWRCDGSKGSLLGTGSFAKVYKGFKIDDPSQVVAIKVVDVLRLTKGNKRLRHHLASEIQIIQSLNHTNIVRLLDVLPPAGSATEDPQMFLVFEYCPGGDLMEYLDRHAPLSEHVAKGFMKQLALALQFVRSKDIVHRDIKPQNILLATLNDPIVIKLADFGFAKTVEPQALADTICGSPLYMAPEILKGEKYTIKADLWSVGVVLFQMLTGRPPFAVKSQLQLIKMVEREKEVHFPSDISVSKDCVDLVESLLQVDHSRRISWEEFFHHPWLNLFERPTDRTYSFNSPSSPTAHLTSPKMSHLPDPKGSNLNEPVWGNFSSPFQVSEDKLPLQGHNFIFGETYGSSTHPPSPDKPRIPKYEVRSKRALAIASLGDLKLESEDRGHALVLYAKALTLLQDTILEAKNTAKSMESSSLDSFITLYSSMFSEYLQRANRIREGIRLTDTVLTAEQCIYEFVMHLGKEGGVQELLQNWAKAATNYENGTFLLQELLAEVKEPADTIILQKYQQLFAARLAETQKSMKSATQ